jgi:hypothetical protein
MSLVDTLIPDEKDVFEVNPKALNEKTSLAMLLARFVMCDLTISLSFLLTHIASNGWLLKPVESYL